MGQDASDVRSVNEQIKLTHYRACKLTHPRQKKGADQEAGRLFLGLEFGRRGGVGEEGVLRAGLAAFAQAVGVAADVDDGGLVQEPVEGGAGHDGVAGEDLGPVGEGFVGGEHDGPAGVVALGDDLEQQRGLGRFEGEVADLVEDEQLGPGEVLQFAMEPVFGQSEGELAAASTALTK